MQPLLRPIRPVRPVRLMAKFCLKLSYPFFGPSKLSRQLATRLDGLAGNLPESAPLLVAPYPKSNGLPFPTDRQLASDLIHFWGNPD